MFGNKYLNFNYEITNEEFENDKIWVVILKLSTLITLKTMVKFDSNPNLKIIDLSNNKFKFSNKIILVNLHVKENRALPYLESRNKTLPFPSKQSLKPSCASLSAIDRFEQAKTFSTAAGISSCELIRLYLVSLSQ